MREYKFRAWDTLQKGYDYDVLMYHGKACYIDAFDALEFYDVGRFVIEQYTGLKDRNGKDIYEGDIVQIQGHPFEGPMQINGNYEVGYNDRMELCYGSLLLHRVRHYATVIGNKFGNPSLLEAK